MKLTLEDIAQKGKCSALAADLVVKGLRYATGVKELEGATSTHVSARELCDAVRDAANAYYGPSVSATFDKAGIRNSEDIGRIVFSLIEEGILTKRGEDTKEDF